MGTRERALALGTMGDFWDVVTFKPVRDVAGDVINDIPGLNDLVNGPLRDFARTAVGHAVLIAISGAFYGTTGSGLVPWVGPQLASVAFAVPGLMAGDDFLNAWLQGVKERTDRTLEMAGSGPAQDFTSQLTDTLKNALPADYNVNDTITASVKELADKYGIRQDAAAYAKALWNKLDVPATDSTDPVSGNVLGGILLMQGAGVSPAMLASQDIWGSWSSENKLSVETAALTNVPGFSQYRSAPTAAPSSYSAANTSPNRKSGDLLLGASIIGAAAALWFYFKR